MMGAVLQVLVPCSRADAVLAKPTLHASSAHSSLCTGQASDLAAAVAAAGTNSTAAAPALPVPTTLQAAAGSAPSTQLCRQQQHQQNPDQAQEQVLGSLYLGSSAQDQPQPAQAQRQGEPQQQISQADKGRPYPLVLSRPIGPCSYRLVLGYDGTEYCGFQLQRSRPTVQAALEQALTTRLQHSRDYINVRGAGRTDAGVHARGQVAQFFTDKQLDLVKLPYQINRLLPNDVRVYWASRTAPDFNVSFSSSAKTYHYWIDTGTYPDALHSRFRWHVPQPLSLEAMRAGAALLQGTHDFGQFCNDNADRTRRNPVKTLWRVEVLEVPSGLCIHVHGSGFLYRMVRHIVGSLVAVGQGRLPLSNIITRLEVGSSISPGEGGLWRGYNVAPAKGLVLHEVEYPPEVDDPSVLLYPELPHNEHGQCLVRLPGENYSNVG